MGSHLIQTPSFIAAAAASTTSTAAAETNRRKNVPETSHTVLAGEQLSPDSTHSGARRGRQRRRQTYRFWCRRGRRSTDNFARIPGGNAVVFDSSWNSSGVFSAGIATAGPATTEPTLQQGVQLFEVDLLHKRHTHAQGSNATAKGFV